MFGTTLRHAVRLNWAWRTPLPIVTHACITHMLSPPPVSPFTRFPSILKEPIVPFTIPLGEVAGPGPERVNPAQGLSPGLIDWLGSCPSQPPQPPFLFVLQSIGNNHLCPHKSQWLQVWWSCCRPVPQMSPGCSRLLLFRLVAAFRAAANDHFDSD